MVDTSVQVFASEVPQIDAEFASQFLEPREGVTIIEQWPSELRTRSGLFVPDGVAGAYRNRPDIGTVLAAWPSTGLLPGDHVLFVHNHGKRMSGFEVGEYYTDNEVRLFGRHAVGDGRVKRISWRRSIVARLTDLEGGMENAVIRPVGDWVLVRRDDLHDRHEVSGTDIRIHLPASATSRSTKGTVVAVGEQVKDLAAGERVIYLATTHKSIEPLRHILGPEYQDKNLVLMVQDAILSVIEDEAAPAESRELVAA